MENPAPRPKAYSYVRFSTPEQAAGHSLERQMEAARSYAARHGLEMDETLTFRDRGVSAFGGRNARRGALKDFLTAVREGRVARGAYLLVESLDRVSRQAPWDAAETMRAITTEGGITVVDMMDGERQYSAEALRTDHMLYLMMVVRFMRANEESVRKSERVLRAYEDKRTKARDGSSVKPFTRMMPAWLRWDDTERKHVVIPERARIIRSIFEKVAEGWGQHRVAHWLNESGEAPWGMGKRRAEHWHRSYVRKILTNSAVIGTFTPHRRLTDDNGNRVRKPLDAIENYFPAVVDSELFERATARTSATAARGRNAHRKPASIFAGVLKCAHCGGTVTRMPKLAHVYLVCSRANANRAACKRQTVVYGDVEAALVGNAKAIVEEAPRGYDAGDLEAKIDGLEHIIERKAEEARTLVDELAATKSEAIRRRLREKERELEEAQEDLRNLQRTKDARAEPYVLRRLNTLLESLTRRPIDVVEANTALKEAVSRIVMDAEAARLVIYWRHADEPSEGVPFPSRHSRVFGNEAVENSCKSPVGVPLGQSCRRKADKGLRERIKMACTGKNSLLRSRPTKSRSG